MKLASVPLDHLDDAPRNANRLSPQKYAQLVESIRRIGFVQHVLVRALYQTTEFGTDMRWEIVDGHHRARAMRELGETEIPAVVFDGTEDPALVSLALNRLRGETDLAAASLVIDELMSAGAATGDLLISGFSERELTELVAALESSDDPSLDDLGDAEVPEPVGAPVARPYLLDLTFRSQEDLRSARKALRKAAGKGADLADGLLRLVRGGE